MKKVVRLTESDLVRIVKRVILEQSVNCDNDFNKIESSLEYKYHQKGWIGSKLNQNDKGMSEYVCLKDHKGYIKKIIPTITNENLKCVQNKMVNWCKAEGYNTGNQIS